MFNFKVGDRVMQDDWDTGAYIEIICIGSTEFYGKLSDGMDGMWSKHGAWLLYTPPKRKVKMWKWVYRNDGIFETGYHKTEQCAKELLPYCCKILFRLDNSMIEVEE